MAAAVNRKPVGIMPDPLDMREIIFTNFLLLGFDPGTMESKHMTPFNRDMFALPNKKAMEVVMQFLFSRLDPQGSFEEFRNCWPVRDKTKEQRFRKVCYEWVSRIVKEDPHACLPRIVQSLFHSPGGNRFYTFLFHFTSYVLQKVMQRDHGKGVVIPPTPRKTLHNQSLAQVMSKALHAHCVVQRKRFLEQVQYTIKLQKHWKDYALETTKANRCLMKKKRDLLRRVKALAGSKTDYQEEIEALQRTKCIQKVRDLWRSFDDIFTSQRPERAIVNTMLQGKVNKYRIDAAHMQIQVPDHLLRECEEEIQNRNIENTYVGGKVNLLSLIQLWNLSLSLLKRKIQKDPVPEFEQHIPTVASAVHTHLAHLANTKAMRTSLHQEILPDVRENVERLKAQLYSELEEQQQRGQQYVAPFNLGLGLVPPTPPVSFAAADTPVSQHFTSFQETLRRKSRESVSTPDVVQAWTRSLKMWQNPDDDPSTDSRPHRTRAESSEELQMGHGALPSRLPRPVEKACLKETGTRKTLSQKKPVTLKGPKTTGAYSASRPKARPSSLLPSKETPKAETGTASIRKNKSRTVPHKRMAPRKDDRGSVALVQEMLEDKVVSAVAEDQVLSGSRRSSQSSSAPSTPKEIALEDPLGSLDANVAFVSRDRITRTPPLEEQKEAVPPTSSSASKTPLASAGLSTGRVSLLETILKQSEQHPMPHSPQSGLLSPFSSMLVTRSPASVEEGTLTSVLDTSVRDEDRSDIATPFLHLSWHNSLTEQPESHMANEGIGHTRFGGEPGEASPASRDTLTPVFTELSSGKSGQISFSADDAELDFSPPRPLFQLHELEVPNGTLRHALFEDEPDQGDPPSGHTHQSPFGNLLPNRNEEYGQLSPVNVGISSSLVTGSLGSSRTLATENVPSRNDEETTVAPETTQASVVCGENDSTLPPAKRELISTAAADRNESILPMDLLERLQKIKQAPGAVASAVFKDPLVEPSEVEPNRVGKTWAGSFDTAQLASRLQEIRGGAQRQQVMPQSSGQSSPGSALSEMYLRHSPFNPNGTERARAPSPQERVFYLGDVEEADVGGIPDGQSTSVSDDLRRGSWSDRRKSARKSLEGSFSSARKPPGVSRGFGTPNPDGFWLTNEKRLSFEDLLEDSPPPFWNGAHGDTTPLRREGTGLQHAAPAVGQLIDFG